MAVDIVSVCAVASSNQSSHSLAIILSVLFSVYTLVSVALSALTIYTSSQMRSGADGRPAYPGRGRTISAVYPDDASASLVNLPG